MSVDLLGVEGSPFSNSFLGGKTKFCAEKRRNPPCFFDEFGRILERCSEKSEGRSLLCMQDSVYKNYHYLYHKKVSDKTLVIISMEAVICLTWRLDSWKNAFSTSWVIDVSVLETNKLITVYFYDKSLDNQKVEILCSSPAVAIEVCEQISKFTKLRPSVRLTLKERWLEREIVKTRLTYSEPMKVRTEKTSNTIFDNLYKDCVVSLGQNKLIFVTKFGLLRTRTVLDLTRTTVFNQPETGQWVALEQAGLPKFFRCTTNKQSMQWIDRCVLHGATFRR
eukprot:TRINITY_DN15080_c0_g1_i3.p1 TRINITY_DN15080_c0_g1~~TRINITY_DN15080_c0_g1_i3.p1  ORF type:complete len:279 (+),score=57.33 TRINITY_DN15080_c0_g1_i3:107-943(+)